ncbi:MAG: DUF3795 domain-containing protein [Firmicutes bacterium]|nr:DUF3795 domain-containing protein [Bacillota bacterium]
MEPTKCGADCTQCGFRESCAGCAATDGYPFGGECMIAACCRQKGQKRCSGCGEACCRLKGGLIAEFNALGIEDMPEVTDLNALKGSFVNLEYTLPGGQKIRFWDDNRIYLGNQLCKKGSDRCYGLTADENHLLVCEYGEGGSEAEIVVFKRRR